MKIKRKIKVDIRAILLYIIPILDNNIIYPKIIKFNFEIGSKAGMNGKRINGLIIFLSINPLIIK